MTRAEQADEAGLVLRLREAGCVFAEDEARLLLEAAGEGRDLDELVDRRVRGVPLEQVLGWVRFGGRRVAVEPGVFVPRRRTELVAAEAGRAIEATRASSSVVVELCCGAAAVGLVLAGRHPGIELWASDLDPVAVHCARQNLAGVGTVVRGDLFAGLPDALRGRVDVLAVNAPYVPTAAIATLPPEARLHESSLALDGGADGLDLHRRIAAEAAGWLRPGGTLVVETSVRQAHLTEEALVAHGLVAGVVRDDDVDGTVVVAVRPRGGRSDVGR